MCAFKQFLKTKYHHILEFSNKYKVRNKHKRHDHGLLDILFATR